MPKIRLLVPREIDGKPNAAGAEVDVSDEEAADLRAAGAATLMAEEQAAEKESGGSYSARTTRADAGETAEDKPAKKGKG